MLIPETFAVYYFFIFCPFDEIIEELPFTFVEITSLSKKSSAGHDLSIQIPTTSSRSRSAPEKAQKTARKNWNASSVNIQTARGDKMHLHAPGMCL